MSAMNTARLTIAFILTALSFNSYGQDGKYVKLTRGQINPFDTAVAVEIEQYRKETMKLRLAEALIRNQDSLTAELIDRTAVCDSLVDLKNTNISFLINQVGRKDELWRESERDLIEALDEIEKLERSNRSIFKKPWIWIVAGAAASLVLSR